MTRSQNKRTVHGIATYGRLMDNPDNLPTLSDVQHITLDDGHKLDARQSLAVILKVETNATLDEIAEQAGYSHRSAASSFLRSTVGKQAVQAHMISRFSHAGMVGLRVQLELAEKAKSELVRHQAAKDLLDRAGFVPPKPTARADADKQNAKPQAGAINIQINTGSVQSDTVQIVPAEIEPDKQG